MTYSQQITQHIKNEKIHRLPKFNAACFTAVFGLLALAMPSVSRATEEPNYAIVRKLGEIELRRYAPYAVAEVLMQGAASDVGNQGFPILAGYIFGKNKGERKFEMTSPVIQTADPVKMAMTAPVTQTASSGGFLIQFVLPKGVTAANAPEPLDARVKLRDIQAASVAVIRYSGFWTDANYNAHLAQLQAALRSADVAWVGEPVYSRYNAPFTPWFMRRNEIWLHVENSF
jgi:hypothetical protein